MRRAVLAGLVLAALPASAHGASYTVNTTEDRGGPGCGALEESCSLRQALGRADSGDIVRLPAGSYGLAAPLIITRSGVTLEGDSARETTIDGGAATRLLELRAPGALTIEDVTLRRGQADSQGGAAIVFAGASLTLVDSAVLLSNAGSSGLAGSGGAVHNEGTLVLLRSLLAANRAVPSTVAFGEGGAVLNAGTFVATSSTLSGNAAGGSALAGRGGGVATGAGARTTLVHVTIAGNSAGGAGAGGSLFTAAGGTTTLQASIVTGGIGRPLVDNCDGGAVSRGANVAGGNSCGLAGPGDRSNADPLLDGLRDNGGPTDTHAPRPGSPAIDLVPPASCAASDQRGYVRSPGTGCDAGALERDGQPAPTSDLPPPVMGATFNLQRVEGKVYIRRPGAPVAVRLSAAEQVPIDTIVYTVEGLASVTGQTSRTGTLSTGEFFQGSFSLVQNHPDDDDAAAVPVELQLRGPGPDDCTPARRRLLAKRGSRGLWGRTARGRFRTRGSYSAATVRGTQWFVEDRCDGTLTRVVEGVVAVRDSTLNRTVTLNAGQDYLARPPRCRSRRIVQLKVPTRGRVFSRATVTAGGRPVRVRGRRARIDLRGKPAGVYTVRIRVVLANGAVLRETRRYRTCVDED